MPLFTLTWTETLRATIEADSESAARQAWIDGLDGEPVDNRHEYDLTVEALGVRALKPGDVVVLHFSPESKIYRWHAERTVRVIEVNGTHPADLEGNDPTLVAIPCRPDGTSLQEGIGFYPIDDIERVERP